MNYAQQLFEKQRWESRRMVEKEEKIDAQSGGEDLKAQSRRKYTAVMSGSCYVDGSPVTN